MVSEERRSLYPEPGLVLRPRETSRVEMVLSESERREVVLLGVVVHASAKPTNSS